MVVDAVQYPLTYKWRKFISGYSYRKRLPELECFQEALIVEWEASKKFADLEHREKYFNQILRFKLLRIYKFNSNFQSHCNQLDNIRTVHFSSLKQYDDSQFSESDCIDSIISIRGFDDLFYDELIQHIAAILREIDEVALSMFRLRIQLNMKWKEIRNHYNNLHHNEYYKKVKIIKSVVSRELCYG